MTLSVEAAQNVLKAIDPYTNLVVSEAIAPPPKPFYINSNREPQVGDIVRIPSRVSPNKYNYYLYTSITRNLGHQGRYASNWVSLRYGSPDTGPNWANGKRFLYSSTPVDRDW